MFLAGASGKALIASLGLPLELRNFARFGAVFGATAFGILGAISARLNRAKEAKRTAGFQQTAATMGGDFAPAPDGALIESLGRFFRSDTSVRLFGVQNVIRTQQQGVTITTCDVSFERVTHSSKHGSGTRTVNQTVAFYESSDVRFPSFTLQPEGVLLNLLSGLVGMADIDFPAHPEFSGAYHLSAVQVDRTRALFNAPVIDTLCGIRGLQMASGGGSLVLYRPNQLCEANELTGFVTEAATICRHFEDSARSLAADAGAVPGGKVDIKAEVENLPGLMGRIVRDRLVTREEVDAFVAQPTPRKLPKKILVYRDQVAPGLAIAVGIAFTLAGGLFAYLFATEDVYTSASAFLSTAAGKLIIPVVVMGVGGLITFFMLRRQASITRLLRKGRTCDAKLVSIDKTDSSSGDETLFAMTVEFNAASGPARASFKLTRDALVRARRLLSEGKTARILYDTADPRRILYTDALMQVSPEYDSQATAPATQ